MAVMFTEINQGRNLRTGERAVHLVNYPFGFCLTLDRDGTFSQAVAMREEVAMRQKLTEIFIWCKSHFGVDDYRFVKRTYWFKNVDHAMEFKLRWL